MVEHESSEMPFLDHLEELRWRIIWALVVLGIPRGAALLGLME